MSMQHVMGAGGGGKGGSARVAVEAKDSLRSSQYATVVDLVSEGEIAGLVDGPKSIYLDGVPLVSPIGTSNFDSGFSWLMVNGKQVQDHMPLAPVAVTSEVGVRAMFNVPVTRSVSNPEIDWATVTVGVPTLTSQNTTNGDISGAKVEYKIELQTGNGPYVLAGTHAIEGKTTSRYQRAHKIMLSGNGPWNIRLTRLTADSTTSALQDQLFWDAITTGVDVKLMYPNSAASLLRINADKFNSVPTRGYHIRGMIVRVPTNYNPVTRTYTGSWNGSFKLAYSNNPAWCFYDLCTQKRYGLGDFIGADSDGIDKWTMYVIAKYCDEMVPNGFGGFEPRFTCNLYLQRREEAFKVLNDMASIFRGMLYHANSQLIAVQDAPSDPVALFSDANVRDGLFNRQGADRRARHTVALVSWNDPADLYRQKIEYVQDDEGVRRWGSIETEVAAIGCTSRGQAHRAGKWLLYTERFESEVISFSAGMDAAQLAPGDIIQVQDSVYAGARMSGRTKPESTAALIVLDAPVTIVSGQSYQVTVMMPGGTVETRNVTNAPGQVSTLTLSSPLPAAPAPYAIWMMGATSLQLEQWRVISVKESSDGPFVEVTGVYHHPGKFAAIEGDMVLEPIPVSTIPARPGAVTQVTSRTELFRLNNGAHSTRIALSWANPPTAASCDVSYKRESDNEQFMEARGQGANIDNVTNGKYAIKITTRDTLGRKGETVEIEHMVTSSDSAQLVTNLRANPSFNGRDLPFTWDAVPGAREYEIQIRATAGGTLLRTLKTNITQESYTYAMNVADGGPRRSLHVSIKAHTLLGVSPTWTTATFSNPSPATPSGIEVTAGPGQVSVLAQRPADQDLAGMIVWMGVAADFVVSDANKIYEGSDNAFTKTGLEPGIAKYFRVAFYDSFGKTNLNISTSLMGKPTSLGGVLQVTTLPASPADVEGELAVFLNVENTTQRGLYGWDGTQWVSTKNLLDGSVTSAKLAIAAVQARNLAIKKHFIY